MSDTCIVCLGDLGTGIDAVPAQPNTFAKSPTPDAAGAVDSTEARPTTTTATANNTDQSELIAHLQPCGHELHNECLKPWVERANSCPICRASFQLVELMHSIGGEVVSSYVVENRTQVADLDPSIFLEVPDEEEDEQVCQGCEEGDNEDVLMYCDGCGKLWHTYCVGLEEVPWASWFCDNCSTERTTDPQLRGTRRRQRGTTRRRTRGMERRRRNHQNSTDDGWNQVWQSVWSRINLDLDFPFDEEEAPATAFRRHRNYVETSRREHEAWERRMRVAELAGAGRRFRETESTLLNGEGSTGRRLSRAIAPPPQESPEEMAAWDAFAQAREIPSQAAPGGSRRRKRKSGTSSPAQPHPERESPPREVKRRRISMPVPDASERAANASRSSPSRRASPTPRAAVPAESLGPSFLQSLLQEVEESSGPSLSNMHRPSPRYAASPPSEQQSPRPSSPATSNYSSPRAMSATPPPQPNGKRPGSPSGLTSSIQPVFPSIEYSPQRSVSPEPKEKKPEEPAPRTNGTRVPITTTIARPRPRRPRVPVSALSDGHRSRSNDTSPTRSSLSASKKADVQKLVSAALKPHYHEQKISKDEYTIINRDVSRMLYDQIGDFEALDIEGKARWEKVAGDEVNKAVVALRAEA